MENAERLQAKESPKEEALKVEECGSTVSDKNNKTSPSSHGPLFLFFSGGLVRAGLCHDSPALPPTARADSGLPGYFWHRNDLINVNWRQVHFLHRQHFP
ncbi:hypothetical protein F2P81_004813 [Scophthalmus maximus]|uniref:Uncharacterized protein n=1 Tax=Scophthalmus maximus TaxID=52904 RepID=A0A6A4T7F8_SCOMX|nr:hypothetical protein F2P81_004813 [Scophthalmus maximus]